MNKKLRQKGFNEYEIVIPMSDDNIKNIKANATKIVLGASIAGIMMFGGQSAKAESVHEPQAIIQTAEAQNEAEKQELYSTIDKFMSFNKVTRIDNDEQLSTKRKTGNVEGASLSSDESLLQSSAQTKATKDEGLETLTSVKENKPEVTGGEALSANSVKESKDKSVLNNAKVQESPELEKSSVASVDGKEVEAQAEEEKGEESSANGEHPEKSTENEKKELTLDDFLNNDGIKNLLDLDKVNPDKNDEAEEIDAKTDLEVAEEKPAEGQKAGAEESNEPNYAEDEKKIKDYSGSE